MQFIMATSCYCSDLNCIVCLLVYKYGAQPNQQDSLWDFLTGQMSLQIEHER